MINIVFKSRFLTAYPVITILLLLIIVGTSIFSFYKAYKEVNKK